MPIVEHCTPPPAAALVLWVIFLALLTGGVVGLLLTANSILTVAGRDSLRRKRQQVSLSAALLLLFALAPVVLHNYMVSRAPYDVLDFIDMVWLTASLGLASYALVAQRFLWSLAMVAMASIPLIFYSPGPLLRGIVCDELPERPWFLLLFVTPAVVAATLLALDGTPAPERRN